MKAVIIKANIVLKDGKVYNEECLKLIAKNNPKNFKYDDEKKELIITNKTFAELMLHGIMTLK